MIYLAAYLYIIGGVSIWYLLQDGCTPKLPMPARCFRLAIWPILVPVSILKGLLP